MTEMPAHLVSFADQSYAEAEKRLDDLVRDVVRDIRASGNRADSLPWVTAVIYMMDQMETCPDPDYKGRVMEILTAAVYRLARIKMAQEGS